MPATIIDYTAGTTERGVKVQNSQIFRKIKDDSWTRIRVGVRWIATDDTTSAPTAGAQFALGLCNGSTNGMGSSNRKHCVVATNITSLGAIYTFTRHIEATAFGISWTPSQNYPAKYVNNVQTLASSGIISSAASTELVSAGLSSTFISPIFLFDIMRDTPNYLLYGFTYIAADPKTATTSRQVFLEQMEATVPALSNYQFTGAANGRTLAVDEATDGTLDHFHFYWNRTAPSITILDAAVCKIA